MLTSGAGQDPVGIVLLGGESRRYGQEKHAVIWRGLTLLQHVIAGLPPERSDTIVVARPGQDVPTDGVTVVRDSPELPPGPLRGLITGLEACGGPTAWAVACDLPGLRPALLRMLREVRRPDADVVAPMWGGLLQPLCAYYSCSAAGRLRIAVGEGARSLRTAFRFLQVQEVWEEDLRASDPTGRSFLNINRPEALEFLEETRPPHESTGGDNP